MKNLHTSYTSSTYIQTLSANATPPPFPSAGRRAGLAGRTRCRPGPGAARARQRSSIINPPPHNAHVREPYNEYYTPAAPCPTTAARRPTAAQRRARRALRTKSKTLHSHTTPSQSQLRSHS
jgi:hypothetical protein